MTDKSIEYIANKSKELLASQINSYRSLHQKASTIIAVSALFAPFFLFLVEQAQFWIRLAAAILVVPMIVGIILLLLTLRARKLAQGFDESNLGDLMNEDLKEVHKKEIAYNKYSIEQNNSILISQNNRYNRGVAFIIGAIILSIGLVLTDTIIKNNNSDNIKTKTEDVMTDKEKNKTAGTTDSNPNKEKLPDVDPKKVKHLHEGVEPEKESKD